MPPPPPPPPLDAGTEAHLPRTVTGMLAGALAARGVRRIYGVPGGGSSLDVIAAATARGLRFVLMRNEAAAAMAWLPCFPSQGGGGAGPAPGGIRRNRPPGGREGSSRIRQARRPKGLDLQHHTARNRSRAASSASSAASGPS